MFEREARAQATQSLEDDGFLVLEEPRIPGAHPPEWFRPDLIGVRSGQVVVLELKATTQQLPPDHLSRMRSFAEAQGWEFRLWQYDPLEPAPAPTWQPERLHWEDARWAERLPPHFSRRVWECARIEAALRGILVAEESRVEQQTRAQRARWDLEDDADLQDGSPVESTSWADVLGRLAELGFVEPNEYAQIRSSLAARDLAVHGITSAPLRALTRRQEEQLQALPEVLLERAADIWGRTGNEP